MSFLQKGLRGTLVISFCLSMGCASHQVKSLDEYKPITLEKSKFAPSTEVLQKGKSKIVVFPLSENGNQVAEAAELGLSLAGALEAVLTESNSAEIVDRKIATKLQDEVKLAEMNQTGAYDGPIIADYAVSGSISNASFTHKFFEATRTVDKKGRVTVTAPSFRYTANVEGTIKFYEIPSMKVVKVFKISDNKARSEETRSSQNYAERDDDLVRGAGRDAIGSIKSEIKNLVAPRAYVLDKKVKDSSAIFKVNLGADKGAQPGDKCEIFTVVESVNQISGATETETRKICDGVITNQITPGNSWVMASLDESKEVKLGDQVKVVYSKGAFEYMKDAGSLMNTLISK
ncbi:hypothetical protein KP004_14350 [Geomonas oryzisoli]|uniref:Curli production assembly/transport component CsgG n=1 Tax=Geomonas oryzisoli TaxID=2847992 RepID=A0ABX8J5H8_9BACT|nr:hypothetical protein [Geomonas oryzisoli]QWV92381.1 hypothetical protein KP004_14350 [Geomonas oryzisoli]